MAVNGVKAKRVLGDGSSLRRRLLWFCFVWEPLAEALWAWLRYCDNRRKGKPLTMPWQWPWGIVCYEIFSGYGPGEVEHWREGTPYQYRPLRSTFGLRGGETR